MAISIKRLRQVLAAAHSDSPAPDVVAPLAPISTAPPEDAHTTACAVMAWEAAGLLAPAESSPVAKAAAKAIALARSSVLAAIAKAGGSRAPSTLEQAAWDAVSTDPAESAHVIRDRVATALAHDAALQAERGKDPTAGGPFGPDCDTGKRGGFVKGETKAPRPAQAVARLARDWLAAHGIALDLTATAPRRAA